MDFKSWVLALVVILVAATGGFYWWQQQQDHLPEDIASGNGRIEAVQIDISTKIAGRVETVMAMEGDLVVSGQTLAKIDTAQLQAKLLRAEAGIAGAESEVSSARATIAQANAELILADQEISRARELIKKGHISKETYDMRMSQLAVAKANLEAAKAMLVSRQRSVDAAHADRQEIQTQIDDATLVSPTLGRVLYRLSEPGEVLGSGGKVLTLVNLSDIYMEIFLPSSQAHRIAIGAETRIKLDILDFAIPAAVSFVSPESQFTPKQVETPSEREKLMFRVKVRIPQKLVLDHINDVKTGVRGVAYIRLTTLSGEQPSPWPKFIQQLYPDIDQTSVNSN